MPPLHVPPMRARGEVGPVRVEIARVVRVEEVCPFPEESRAYARMLGQVLVERRRAGTLSADDEVVRQKAKPRGPLPQASLAGADRALHGLRKAGCELSKCVHSLAGRTVALVQRTVPYMRKGARLATGALPGLHRQCDSS